MAKRPGLNFDKIVDAALDCVQAEGESSLTLAAVAKHFGVKPPSLYNHVGSLSELRRAMRLRGLDQLHATLQNAAMGRAGKDALLAVGQAYRTFAQTQPALYRMTITSTEYDDQALQQAGRQNLAVILSILRAYNLSGDDALHATRCLRSALHGFASLEIEGGFAMKLDLDHSFAYLLRQLDGMLTHWADNPDISR